MLEIRLTRVLYLVQWPGSPPPVGTLLRVVNLRFLEGTVVYLSVSYLLSVKCKNVNQSELSVFLQASGVLGEPMVFGLVRSGG